MDYKTLSLSDLKATLEDEQKSFKKLQKKAITVDMTRGRPSKEQLKIAMPMLENAGTYNYDLAGGDARNYGGLGGTKDAKALFAEILDVKADEVVVGDGSSLDLMYMLVHFAMQFGVLGGTPWNKIKKIKFICPAPGYDRHFAICAQFGIDMITVPMRADGPDMDMIEGLVKEDDTIKGIWCVPKYSNPTGVVFSDKVVERMATMKVAASDFRIFWDNSYVVHSLYDTDDKLKNIFDAAKKAGTVNRIYEFVSTAKITFAGSGVAAFASSTENVDDILKKMFFKQICPNKVNQVMHTSFLKNLDNVKKIMAQHAAIMRPKFELFDKKFSEAFAGDNYVTWTKPRGGYFISVDVKSCAKRIVGLAAEAGVKFTAAGATFPYGNDDNNSNIRIAPSVPSLDEMDYAVDVLISAVKQAR
ncbi:MAG: aminotransferase class I/II-fold pyridoxal phosphate-dependent enzyme, partial [Clostridia bacterium]